MNLLQDLVDISVEGLLTSLFVLFSSSSSRFLGFLGSLGRCLSSRFLSSSSNFFWWHFYVVFGWLKGRQNLSFFIDASCCTTPEFTRISTNRLNSSFLTERHTYAYKSFEAKGSIQLYKSTKTTMAGGKGKSGG